MASQAKYARRRRNAFLAAIALALLFIIVVILIIVGISKRSGGNSGDANVPVVTTPGTLPTPDGTGLVPDITPSDDPNNTSGPSPSSTAAGTRMYITGDVVNVREEPSTAQGVKVLTKLTKGTAVTAYELSGDFYQVKLSNGEIGYISKNYLSTTNPANDPTASNSPTPTPDTSNGKTMYVTGDSVNVRAAASSSGTKLTSLKKGAQVTAYVNQNGWYYIQYQSGKFGYISASYLTADAPSTATPTPTPTPTKPPTPSSWLDIGLPQEVIANFGTSVSTQAAYLAQTKVGQTVSPRKIDAHTYYRIEKNDGYDYYIAIETGNDEAKAYIYESLDHIPGRPVT